MNTPYIINQSELIENLIDLSTQIEEEKNKEDVDKEKLFKLQYQQLIKGMYLTQIPFYNNK